MQFIRTIRFPRPSFVAYTMAFVAALFVLLAGAPAQALAQELAVSDATVAAEGATGTTQSATFTITRSGTTTDASGVTYSTSNATAIAPADYTALAPTAVTFAPGETTKQVVVTVNGDALDEADETFSLQLGSPTGATITDATAIATIVDDDPPPGVTVSDPSVAEGAANLVFTVTLSAVSGRSVTVDYATADGTATSAMLLDYTARTDTLTFVAGVVTQTVSVAIHSDALDEVDETVLLNLTNAINATITDAQGIGTIVDDDGPTISIDDVTLNPEGATATTQTATFTISLSTASTQTVTVRYATANATAVAPADYTAVALTALTFAPGETSKQATVTVNGDALDETDETFQVQLSAPAAGTPMNATIQDAAGIATIPDDDPLPTLSVSDPTVAEGTGTSRSLVYTITQTPVSGRTVTVDYATADATAVSTGSPIDYTARNGTLSFSPGVTTLTVSVALTTDSIDELDETLFLNLTNATNATITDAQGIGTISDDDGPTIAVNDITVAEGDTGTTNATFTVTLSATSVQPVTFKVVTANDTAVQPGDYTPIATATPVTIASGQTTASVTIVVKGDTVDEADERFRLTLSEAVGGTLSDATGLATITDDDAAPSISVDDASIDEGSIGMTNVVLTVSLDRPSERTILVGYTTADVTATKGVDYGEATDLLTFNVAQTSRTITIPITPDSTGENDETFTVTLSNPINASLGDGVATVTIVDDDVEPDPDPTLSIDDVRVDPEGAPGVTRTASFTISLSTPAPDVVTLIYATANGTAVAPSDYTAVASTQVAIPAGQTSAGLDVTVNGDVLDEADETFAVLLTTPANATISDAEGIATIVDDDPAATQDPGPSTTPPAAQPPAPPPPAAAPPPATPPPPAAASPSDLAPVAQVRAVVRAMGDVNVEVDGRFIPLKGVASVPVGATIDATNGSVTVTTAADSLPRSARDHRDQRGTFAAGIFKIKQSRLRARGRVQQRRLVTDIVLVSPRGAQAACRNATTRRALKGKVRSLSATVKGRFRTIGGASIAAISGDARWLTIDRCDGTLTEVGNGRVEIRHRRTNKITIVRSGQAYLAFARLFRGTAKS